MEVAIVDASSGNVLTVIGLESLDGYDPGEGLLAIECTGEAAYHGCSWSQSSGFQEPAATPLTPDEFAALKAASKRAVNDQAEAERLKHITPGAGQARCYLLKADEADRYLAAVDPDPADYPLLAAEVGITAADMRGVADVVKANDRSWRRICVAIEPVRLGTKAAIDAATTPEGVEAAMAAVVWPNPSQLEN